MGMGFHRPRYNRFLDMCLLSGVARVGSDRLIAHLPSTCRPEGRRVFARHLSGAIPQRSDVRDQVQ